MFKKVLLLFFFILLLSSPVLADKLTIESQNGYGILTPKQEAIKEGRNYTMHIDVYDLGDGTYVDNETATCYLSVYSQEGKNSFFSDINYHGTNSDNLAGEWHIEIPGDTFDESGTYTYMVECDDDEGNSGGARSETFLVTPTGNKPTTAQGITYLGIMAITLVFLGLTIFGSIWIKWDNKRNGRDDIIGINELKYGKLGLIFLSYLLLLFLFGIGKDVTQAYLFLSGAYSLFNIGFTILLVGLAPVLISTIAFIIIGIISDKETQKAISRGIDPRHVGRGRR